MPLGGQSADLNPQGVRRPPPTLARARVERLHQFLQTALPSLSPGENRGFCFEDSDDDPVPKIARLVLADPFWPERSLRR